MSEKFNTTIFSMRPKELTEKEQLELEAHRKKWAHMPWNNIDTAQDLKPNKNDLAA